jgi:hypothetical protein
LQSDGGRDVNPQSPITNHSVRALALAFCTIALAHASAAQQRSPNDSVPPAAARAVLAIDRAAELAIAGRRDGDAGALVDAAELLLATPSWEALFPDGASETDPGPLEPRLLLNEAARLAGEDAALSARIAQVRDLVPDQKKNAPAVGAERGPLRYGASVAAGATRRHQLHFTGPEAAVIQVRGSGSTNLDLYLYDVNGDRVAVDEHPSDVATLHWYVPYTQTLTLVVRNRGRRANGYYVITN